MSILNFRLAILDYQPKRLEAAWVGLFIRAYNGYKQFLDYQPKCLEGLQRFYPQRFWEEWR